MTLTNAFNHSSDRPCVYLDNQATERLHPEVAAAMEPFWSTHIGNASATHGSGRFVRTQIESARNDIAFALGGDPEGLIFTSGATEGNNLVVSSLAARSPARLVVSAIEHKCVLESAARLERAGAEVNQIPVNSDGIVDLEALVRALDGGADLVSIMIANNEVGVVQPVAEIAGLCRSRGALIHVDAAQAVGRMPVSIEALKADFLTVSAHKLGGPQGIGAVLCRPSAMKFLRPFTVGGGQERNLRSGTLPNALCVGMGVAVSRAVRDLDRDAARIRALRDELLGILGRIGPFFTNGSLTERLCNNINGGFEGVDALALMRAAPDIHFSTGAACTAAGARESHVLRALGVPDDRIRSSFRLSLGWSTTRQDIRTTCEHFTSALAFLGGRTLMRSGDQS